MGCATGIVKNLVFLFNFLCAIVGLVLIVLGSIAIVNINKMEAATKHSNTFVPAFILSLGVIIFIISFLGCCGVCQRSQCMLTTYAVILLILFVTQLGFGIYGYIQVSGDDTTLKEKFTSDLQAAVQNYTKNPSTKQFFDEFQREFHCCGARGPSDYVNPLIAMNPYYPSSCCGVADDLQCVTPFPDGCADKIYTAIIESLKIVSYVALGICVTEIVAALFAICLVNSYRNDERRGM